LTDRPNPISLYFSRNRALEQLHRHYQPAIPLDVVQNSLDSRQRSTFYQDALADFQKRPRFDHQPGFNHGANSFDFLGWDGRGCFSKAQQPQYPWYREYWKAVIGVDAAKDIPGKQRLIDLFLPIRPNPLDLIGRRKFLKTATSQVQRRSPFIVGTDPDGKPWEFRRRSDPIRTGSQGQPRALFIHTKAIYRLTEQLTFVNIAKSFKKC